MKTKLFAVLFLAISNALLLDTVESVFGNASDKQFIYGKLTTTDGDTYKGQIRWGNEEAFWFDFFNSTKMENDNLKWLSKSEEQALKGDVKNSYSWLGIKKGSGWNYSIGTTHVFACQFGDIKSIQVKKDERVFVSF